MALIRRVPVFRAVIDGARSVGVRAIMLLTTRGRQKDTPPGICLDQSRVTAGRLPENLSYNHGQGWQFRGQVRCALGHMEGGSGARQPVWRLR